MKILATLFMVMLATSATAQHLVFDRVGDMPVPSAQLREVLLPSGRVLITGGQSGEGGIANAHLYNPASRSFTPLPNMTEPRFVHAMNLLPDGRVLITGGFSEGGQFLQSTEFFDGDKFVSGPQLIENRDNQRTVNLTDSRVFIEGGDNEKPKYISSTEIFDGHGFIAGPKLPTDRAMDTITLLNDGRVLMAGGLKVDDALVFSRDTAIFDPRDNSIKAGPLMNSQRKQHRATKLEDGTVLITGGSDARGDLRSAELYIPTEDRFLVIAPMKEARREHCSVMLDDGRVILIGGYNGSEYSATTELYDPATRAFSPGPALHDGRAFHGCTKLQDGSVLVAGGKGNTGYLKTAELLAQGPAEHSPPRTEGYLDLGNAEIRKYHDTRMNAADRTQDYSAGNNYLNYGQTTFYRESANVRLDPDGLPMQKSDMNDDFHYTPGMLANFALAEHGRYTLGGTPDMFIKAAEKLRSIQESDGSLRYNYEWRHYSEPRPYASGWYSGMDQGLVLSVFARAYAHTRDAAYLEAGNRALSFLLTPFPTGPMSDMGDLHPSLANFVFFLEYPTDPNVYTLNGFMFTLLGLYDWWKITSSNSAGNFFTQGIDTLENILDYYDIGNFSAYDLSYITAQKPYLTQLPPRLAARYHALHIAQLRALYSVTQRDKLREVSDRWQSYVEQGPEQ